MDHSASGALFEHFCMINHTNNFIILKIETQFYTLEELSTKSDGSIELDA